MFSRLKIRKRIITVVSLFFVLSTVNADVAVTTSPNSTPEGEISYGSCLVEKVRYFVDWVGKELKSIDDEYFRSKSNQSMEDVDLEVSIERLIKPVSVLEEKPSKPLNLNIPDIEHLGTMPLDKGQKLNFPDMFSGQLIKPSIKEEAGASFGGRILMDEAEIEGMQEYRFNDVKGAIRGAELSLEFKTN